MYNKYKVTIKKGNSWQIIFVSNAMKGPFLSRNGIFVGSVINGSIGMGTFLVDGINPNSMQLTLIPLKVSE